MGTLSLMPYSSVVMAQCWYVDPEVRPSFNNLCSIMERFLSVISDYREMRMVLVEDVNGMCLFSPCAHF